NRNSQVKQPRITMRGFRLVNTRWPTGKNECERVQLADPLGRYIMAHDPGEGVPLAHATRDQLHILRPEVHDQDRAILTCGTFGQWPQPPIIEARRIGSRDSIASLSDVVWLQLKSSHLRKFSQDRFRIPQFETSSMGLGSVSSQKTVHFLH